MARIPQLEAQIRQTQAALADAHYQLSQRDVIRRRKAASRTFISATANMLPPMTPVVSVLPPSNIYVRFFVPETEFARDGNSARASRSPAMAARRTSTATITFIAQQEEFTAARDLQRRQSREARVQARSARAGRLEAQSRPARRSAAAHDGAQRSPSTCTA